MSEPLGVLLVDDDFMVSRVHRQFVDRVDGFEVVGEARTAGEAIEAVQRLQPDLVLLDIYLPDRSGLEVLRTVRGSGHEVDVLVVTAARDIETVRESLRGGAVQYLIKPFGFEDLRTRLEEFARTRRAVHAAQRAGRQIAQEQVDAFFTAPRVPSRSAPRMPKGLTPQTLELVLTALRKASDAADPTLSAAECATATGLARVSVRRYLEYLTEQDRAEVTLRYGRAGRPERRYRWLASDGP